MFFEKLGPFDFSNLLVAPDLTLYEKRIGYAVTDSTGNPYKVLPDGVTWHSWERFKINPRTDRVVKANLLVPVLCEESFNLTSKIRVR